MRLTATRLAVPSRNVGYLAGVDHLRGLAALLMVAYHAVQQLRMSTPGEVPFPEVGDPLRALVVEGHTAVALFMVLSGFILTYGADRRELSARGFLRNRALRVLPMYLVVLAIGVLTHPEEFSLAGVLPYLTLLGTPPLPLADLGAWSAVLWTVSVEFAFYLLFPFLLAILQRGGVRALLGIVVTANALRLLVAIDDPVAARDLAYWTIVGRIDQFVIGMVGAWLLRRAVVRWSSARWSLVALGSSVVVLLALWWFNANGSFYGAGRWRAVWPLVEGLLWAGVVVGYVAATAGRSGRAVRLLALPGVVSYSLYLLHYPVVRAVAERSWSPFDRPWLDAGLLSALVVLPVAAAIATLCYLTVEKPFMERRGVYLAAGPS